MPQYFHRLENALKRANEFIDVGKKVEALEILCDVLRSRKHRTWQKNHADIMVKYLELCVELRRSYVAKEGIYQYKIICQQTQVKSFEDVVRKYLELAEAKAEAAKEAAQAATLDVDDLDYVATPESILLSAVSSEVSQDRTDRVVLLPWVKFLWESYRQCLDLLRNNARTEKLYHDIAHKAFQFCIRFNRKTEFRKLCDNLHTHLDILKKQQQQLTQQQPTHTLQNIVNLSNPESMALHLETRLQQLDCAITMELWQEAYKATDDIKKFGLMNLINKKPIKPQLMASYYQKLALVFYKANCPLFHAAALLRHFLLTKEWRKNIKEEEVQRIASKVVLATLSMPIPPTRPEIDKLVDTEENVVENHHRNLASLLGLTVNVPNRSSLIRDLRRMNVLSYAYPELQQLYQWLEVEFDPLQLCKKVETTIAFIEKTDTGSADLKSYIQPLKEVTIVRLLKELSQIYQTIQLKRVLELCSFADSIVLEHFIVSAARRNDLQVRIDHRRGCLHFGSGTVSSVEEVIEGPHTQSMPSSQIRLQLVNMYSALQNARALIEPERIKMVRDKTKSKIITEYDRTKNMQHKRILERGRYIEQRKEEIQAMRSEREEEELRLQEEQQQKVRHAEEARMKREAEERARLRQAQEEEELKRRMAKDTIENMKLTEAGQKILESFGESELADLKVEEIKSKQYEQLEKERKEQMLRQQKLERKIDHLERAKRLEELPLLEEMAKKDAVLNREIFEKMELERIEELKTERTLALKHRDRLLLMKSEATAFAQKIKSQRYAEYQEKLNEWNAKVAQARSTRLEARKKTREEERRREYYRKKKEEEDARKEAELKEKRERERKQMEEERARLDEVAKKQRLREEEIEAKLREKEMRTSVPVPDHSEMRPRAEESWKRGERVLPPTREEPRARTLAENPPDDDEKWRRHAEPSQPSEKAVWKPRRHAEEASNAPPSDRGNRYNPDRRSDAYPQRETRPEPQMRPADETNDWRRGQGQIESSSGQRREFSRRDLGDRDDRADFSRNTTRYDDSGPRHRDSGRNMDMRRGNQDREITRGGHPEREMTRGPQDRDFGRGGQDREMTRGPPRDDDRQWRGAGGPRDDKRKVIQPPPHFMKPQERSSPGQQEGQGQMDEGWTTVNKKR